MQLSKERCTLTKEMLTHDKIIALQEHVQAEAMQTVIDTLESMGIEPSTLGLSFYIKDKSKVKWKTKTHFIKVFVSELQRLHHNKILNFEQLGFLTVLSTYMHYQDPYLRTREGSYLTQKDIIDMSGWGKKKVIGLLNELKNKKVLLSTSQPNDKRKKRYFIDPNLFYIGNEIDQRIKEHYSKDKKKNNDT